ncbi:MAG: hypothetical protein E7177_06760 [Erysipelotrichaceae bacterium]|nr:hypothetical protein [Erysipelotrichaceae bacterium]
MSESKKRVFRTMIAVLIAMMLYVVLLCVDKIFGLDHKEWLSVSNMYTPFFGSIAAIYVINKYAKDSIKSAKRRSIGSIIGGIYGMILSLIIEYIFLDLINIDVSNIDGLIIWKIVQFVVVGVSIVPLIALLNKFKLSDALFITGLTYFSVTISIRNGGMPVVQFAINRILSTIIGVGIALLVNHFYLFRHKNKNITFICSFENENIQDDYSFDNEEIYLTNRLCECDANLIFATSMNFGELGKIFSEVDLDRPIILMNGAIVYDNKKKEIIYVNNIEKETANEVKMALRKYVSNIFTHTVINNNMLCYYQSIINEGEQDYFRVCYEQDEFRFVYGDSPLDLDICCLSIIVNKKVVENILSDEKIKNNKNILVVIEKCKNKKYIAIHIYNKDVSKINALKAMNLNSENQLIVIGSKSNDLELIKSADYSMCFDNSNKSVKEEADLIIKSTTLSCGLKYIKKIYHSRNIKKTINKLKN